MACVHESKFNWIKLDPGILQFVCMKASSISAGVKVPGSKNPRLDISSQVASWHMVLMVVYPILDKKSDGYYI